MPQWPPSHPVKPLSYRFNIHLYPLRLLFLLQLGQRQTIMITTEFQPFPLNSGMWRHGSNMFLITNNNARPWGSSGKHTVPWQRRDFYSAATKGSEDSFPRLIPSAWVCGGPNPLLVLLEMALRCWVSIGVPSSQLLGSTGYKVPGDTLFTSQFCTYFRALQISELLGWAIVCFSLSSQCNSLLSQARETEGRVGSV